MKQNASFRTPLVVQGLRFHTSSARDMGSIPGQGTKIPYTAQHGKKKKINENDKMLALSLVVGIFCEYSLPADWITEVIK